MTEKIKREVLATRATLRSFAEFTDAAALAAVSGYAIHAGLTRSGGWFKALLFSGVLISLQAFILLVKHFNSTAREV